MTSSSPNPYLRTQVMTASPQELRLLLFDGALKHAQRGRRGIAEEDWEAAYEGISRCQRILVELINSLDPQHAPDLCEKLSGLYTFLYTRLITGLRRKDPQMVDEVIKLLEYERRTWAMLLEKLADAPAETAPPPPAAPTPRAPSAAAGGEPGTTAPPPPSDKVSSLISGRVSLEG